ncbi:MAG: tetratricopeptide repeat protein [Cyanobacteriota/Melainabacteria group bacterium]
MAKTFPGTSTIIKLLSVTALLSGSLSLAQSAGAKELSYEEALKALNQTKEHTDKASGWGERRTISVPKGQDPNKVIQEKLIHVPGVSGIDGPTTPRSVQPIKVDVPLAPTPGNNNKSLAPAAPATPAVQERQVPVKSAKTQQPEQNGGWDWVNSKDNSSQSTSAPVAQTPAQPAQAQVSRPAPTPVSFQAPAVPTQQTFTPVTQSTMKTVYEAPVTSVPKKATNPVALKKNSDNLLDLDEGKAVQKAQADSTESAPAASSGTTSKVDKEKAAEFYNRAVKNHLTGKLDQAISDYRAAIEANPELGQAHCNLGLIFNQRHEYDPALVEFRKALAINPKDAFTYNGIGAALRAQKDYDGALKNWQTATSLKPDLATAHYNLGTVYELKKDYDKAMIAYKDAIKHDYRLGEAYFRTGLILVRKNRLQEAKEQFKKSLEISDKAEYSEAARKKIALIESKGS